MGKGHKPMMWHFRGHPCCHLWPKLVMPATKTHVGPGEQGRELCLNVLSLQTQAVKLSATTSELSSAHGYSCKWKIQNTLPSITVLMVQSRFPSKLRDSCLVTKCSLTSFCTMINEVVST